MLITRKINFEMILIFIIIFISKETLLFGTNIDKMFISFRNVVFLILFPLSFYWYKKRKNRKLALSNKKWIIISIVCFLIFLSGLFGKGGLELAYFIKISMLLTGVYLACLIPYKNFYENFEKLIIIVSFCSIFAYVLNLVTPNLIHSFPILTNISQLSFYNLFITTIPAFDYDRLFGPFREPGVYAIYLCLALYMHVVINEKLSVITLVILVATLILTKSTAGYLLLFIVLLLYLIKNKKVKNTNRIFILLLISGAFYGVYSFTDILSAEGEVFGKFSVEGSESQISRFGSIYGNILITQDYPILGVGLNGIIELFPKYCQMAVGFPSEFNTNTILMQFSIHGCFFGLLFCYYYFNFFIKNSWNLFSIIISCIFGFMLLSAENVCDNFLLYLIFGYGMSLSRNNL